MFSLEAQTVSGKVPTSTGEGSTLCNSHRSRIDRGGVCWGLG